MTKSRYLQVSLVLFALAVLSSSACAKRLSLRLRNSGASVEVDLQSLGEYPSAVQRLRLTESASGLVVWEVQARKAREGGSAPQLWKLTFMIGMNPSQIENALAGGYEVLAPLGQTGFRVEADREYSLEVWATEGGRPSRARFTLRGAAGSAGDSTRLHPAG